MHKGFVILAVALLGLGGAACGGGDGPSSADRLDAFCNLVQDTQDSSDLDPTVRADQRELEALFEDLRAAAPDSIADDVDVLIEAFQAIADEDTDKLEDPAFQREAERASDNLSEFASDECGIEPDETTPPDETSAPVDTAGPDETSAPDVSLAPDVTTGDPTAEALPVEVSESGVGFFPAYDDVQGTWVALVTNPNTDLTAQYIQVQATFKDAAGAVVGSDTSSISELPPGETRAVGSDFLTDVQPTATSVEVVVNTDSYQPVTTDAAPTTFEGLTVRVLADGGLRVVAEMKNPNTEPIEGVSLVSVFRDPAGTIIGGTTGYTDFVPPEDSVGVEVETSLVYPEGTTAEIYADYTAGYTDDDEIVAEQLTVAESGFAIHSSYGTPQGSWAAIVGNPNSDLAAVYVSLVATFYDAAGAIIDVDRGSIVGVAPAGSTAFGTEGLYDPPIDAASMEVRAWASDWIEDPPAGEITVTSSTTTANESSGLQVVGEVLSSFAATTENVEVTAIFRDEAGAIVGGTQTYLDFVPANGSVGFTIDSYLEIVGPITTEVWVDFGNAFYS